MGFLSCKVVFCNNYLPMHNFFLLSILIDIILTKPVYIRKGENKFETIPQCRE